MHVQMQTCASDADMHVLQFHAEVCYERACYSFMPKCVMSGRVTVSCRSVL